MREFTVSKAESGLSIDKFIERKANVNKAFLSIMERKKQVRINGVHISSMHDTVRENDIVKLFIDDSAFKKERKAVAPFDIAFEDSNILIIDKDVNEVVHGATKDDHNNLVDKAVKYLIDKGEYVPSVMKDFRPSASNRLDTNTKGLVIISKNKETSRELNRLIENRKIGKTYKAVVKGTFREKEGILKDYMIGPDQNFKVKVVKSQEEGSKEIKTGFKVIGEANSLSILEVDLITGRTHQIRAHMAFINHPVIGDDKYGDRRLNESLHIHHQQLIAWRLSFNTKGSSLLSYLDGKTVESKKKFDI